MDETFNVKISGQSHSVQGDPARLTLRKLIESVPQSGAQGGERDGRVRVGSREYGGADFGRSLLDLGIPADATIEVQESQPA